MAATNQISVPEHWLNKVLAEIEIDVKLSPGSGLNLTSDWWTARLDSLQIECTDYGVDAALIGLTANVRAYLLDPPDPLTAADNATLMLRLWTANEDQTMGRLLDRSARLNDWEDDEICETKYSRSSWTSSG